MSGSPPPVEASRRGGRLPVRYRLSPWRSSRSSRRESIDARPRRGRRRRRAPRAPRGHLPAERARRRQARRLRVTSARASARSTSSCTSSTSELNVAEVGFDSPDRDVFFSSKGHDVPGLYAALYGLGVHPGGAARAAAPARRARRPSGRRRAGDRGELGLARHGHLEGSRDRAGRSGTPGAAGVVVVMTGDGELQEGQNWEALQAAAHDRLGGLWIVVDRNELQSDKPHRGDPRARRPRDEAARVRLGGRDVRRARPRGAARRVRAVPRRRRRAEGARRRHDQGRGRLVHGASGCARAGRRARIAGMPAHPATSRSSARATSSPRGSRRASRRSGSSRPRT